MKEQQNLPKFEMGIETDAGKAIATMEKLASLNPLSRDLALGFLSSAFHPWLDATKTAATCDEKFSLGDLDSVLAGGLFYHMERDDAAEECRISRKALDALSAAGQGPVFVTAYGIRFYSIASIVEHANALPLGSVTTAARVPYDFWEEFEIV